MVSNDSTFHDYITNNLRNLFLTLVFLSTILLPGTVFSDEVKTGAKVTEATIYRNGAQVKESITESLPAGSTTLVVELPDTVKEDSFRVYSGEESRILTFRVKKVHLERVADSSIKKLKTKIDDLKTKRKVKMAGVEANELLISFLKNFRTTYNKKLAEEQLSKSFLDQEVGQLASFLVDEFQKSRENIVNFRDQIEDIDARIDRLKRKLDQIQNRGTKITKKGVIEVERNNPGNSSFTLVYQLPEAGWEPIYDLRVTPDNGTLNLGLFGKVHQNTGDTWHDVDLTLSTGRPSTGANLPEPEPEYLEPPEETTATEDQAFLSRESKVASALQQKEQEDPVSAGSPESGMTVEFPARQISTLPGNRSTKRILLLRKSLPVELSYRAAPLLTDEVYLQFSTRNTLEYSLPGGTAEIFVDGGFVGDVNLQPIVSGDTLTETAGVDQRLTANREKLLKKQGSSFWSDRTGVELKYNIKIKNGRDTQVTMTVIDRVPVPKHDDITVEIDNVSKPYTRKNNGLIFWDRQISASSSRELQLNYTVTVPPEWAEVLPD